jgi:hypothetical protein
MNEKRFFTALIVGLLLLPGCGGITDRDRKSPDLFRKPIGAGLAENGGGSWKTPRRRDSIAGRAAKADAESSSGRKPTLKP